MTPERRQAEEVKSAGMMFVGKWWLVLWLPSGASWKEKAFLSKERADKFYKKICLSLTQSTERGKR